MKVLYTKYNRERLPQYQTETTIYEQHGVLWAKKRALSHQALEHIRSIHENYHVLTAEYKNVYVAKATMENNEIIFEHIPGKSFDAYLIEALLQKNKLEFLRILGTYAEMIKTMGPTKIVESKEFFGKEIALEAMNCLSKANIDITFDNVFLGVNGQPPIIDYEWVFPFIPIKFIMFRSIYIFNHKYTHYLRQLITLEEIYGFVGIEAVEIACFERMESAFQEYVHGENRTYSINEKYSKKIARLADVQTEIIEKREKLAEIIAWAHSLEGTIREQEQQIADYQSSRSYKMLLKYFKLRDRLLHSRMVILPRLINKKNAQNIISHIRQESILEVITKIKTRVRNELAYGNIGINAGNEQDLLDKEKDSRVSIIIPVYNNAHYLEQCITSALEQTYSDIEIIAIDDCSTDQTVYPILASFEGHPRFHWQKNDVNRGISATMNHAIMVAKGQWIAFLDCDDWLEPDAVEKLMGRLYAKPGSLYGYTDRVNELEATGDSNVESFSCRSTKEYFKELLIGMYTSHLKIIHKEVFLSVGLHESRFDGAQDYDIALKTAFHFGDRAFCYLPEAVYHHRIHRQQTTTESAQKIEKAVQIMKNEAVKRMDIKQGHSHKLVSLVILSFEKKEMTLRCIESIKKTVRVPYEIILFDNASSAATVEFIKEQIEPLDNVQVVYSAENLGCPGGRRKAIKMAKGDYVINLDNDIIVTPHWLEELIIRADGDAQVAAVCCKTIFPDGKVQFNGGQYRIVDEMISFSLIDSGKKEKDVATALWHECDWVPGGATLFKRDVLAELDYSTGYVNAYEDNDISLQITRMGRKVLNCPSAKVYHYHIMFDQKQASAEQEYMKVRYNNAGLMKSLITFYNRNKLVIDDPYVFKLMGMSGLSSGSIKDQVQKLAKGDDSCVPGE